MLELEDLKLRQGDFSLTANLTIKPGRIVAVLGPSGAGKSTLLAAIAGFLPLTGGHILWQGRDLTDLAPAARPVSMLFQDNNLFAHLNARDNIGLGLKASLRLSQQDWARVEEALQRVGLDGLGGRKPADLSGGQMARVALARALLRARPLMLLDEPFGALGPGLKAEMLTLVKALASEAGATLLMVSHDPDDAQKIADEVILVDAGQVQPPHDTAGFFAAPPPAIKAYLGK